MKRGSSENRKKGKRPSAASKKRPMPQTQQAQQVQSRRYPTRDNVYQLQPELQRRRALEEQRQRQQQSGRGRKRSRKRKPQSIIMPAIVFVIIAIYLLGQVGMLLSKHSDINVETVTYGTINTPKIYNGLILREEYVVNSNRAGQPFYQYSQGDYVPKGAVVCTIKDTQSTDALEEKLDKIDKNILESQKKRTDLSAFSEDISRLENNVARAIDAYAGRAMKTNLSYMYTMKGQVTSFMDQRNQIWLTENVESLSQLTQERNTYEKQLAENMSSLAASESGVLCLSYDGLEESLHPDMAGEVTEKQIGAVKTEYISKAKSVQEGDPLFKIIKSNKWYLVAYFPNTDVADWKAQTAKRLNLIADEGTISIRALIESAEVGEKETKVVFSSYEYMEEFMEDRTVSFSLDSTVAEGLKIPNDAIVEKSLLKVPRDCLTESMGANGVMLVKGNDSQFMEIRTLAGDEEAVYIEQTETSLKLGDIVLQGTGETAAQYTISEVQPHAGVYVANSSMAKFVVVEILEQNQEYAIVKAGTITGLQPYDTIVSDAKNITEGQDIY